ncbi:MAG: GNAT family N-acetyltransferase [Nitrososphaerales archaeon]
MVSTEELIIKQLAVENRDSAIPVLEESFEGWYLWHAKRTMRDIEEVLAAFIGERIVGVSMLKMLDSHLGYVYYIAVCKESRRKRVGSMLLEKSLDYFAGKGADQLFVGISEDNEDSKALFNSHGFTQVSFSDLSKQFGRLHAIVLYRKMTIVSGEVVYVKRLTEQIAE